MSPIIKRGRLVVAVDENTEGLASRDSDGQLVGLEIDVARARSRGSIFGDGSDTRLQLRTVTTKQKVDYPADGNADLAISAISMTCERWNKVAFSTEYFTARARVPRARGLARCRPRPTSPARRVCMTKGSTSIDMLERVMRLQPPPVPRLVDARTDCLVALQEGEVDAYFGHDTFLVGMVDQDPGLRIVAAGRSAALRHRIGPGRTSRSCGTSTGSWTGCVTTAPWRASTHGGWGGSTAVPASRCPPCRRRHHAARDLKAAS